MPDNAFAGLIPPAAEVVLGGAREAAEAYLERPIESKVEVAIPGRLERRGDDEVWDGAHTPEAVNWLLDRLPARNHVLCVSILADKRVGEVLARLARAGDTLIATASGNPRALPAAELAEQARAHFDNVVVVPRPRKALARARTYDRPVIVTGSLYLLADLYQ